MRIGDIMNIEKIKEMVALRIAYDNFWSREKQMKNRFQLICSIIELTIGLLAIISFVILLLNNESVIKWFVSLILAIILVIVGITGIIEYKKQK